MTRSFRCLDLSPGRTLPTKPAEELIKEISGKKGVHVFYTHESHISEIPKSIPDACLKKIFRFTSDSQWPNKKWKLTKDSLFALHPVCCQERSSFRAHVVGFFGAIRQRLADSTLPDEGPVVVLAQATVWEMIQDRELMSSMVGEHFHEYLLWDDGGLWPNSSVPYSLTDHTVWHGAGWATGRHRGMGQDVELSLPADLAGYFAAACRALADDNALLAEESQGIPDPHPESPYIQAVCNFLPLHWNERWLEYIVSNNGEVGGPRPWRGILDEDLGVTTRQLLLDGWLTPWPVPGENGAERLLIQPGSLAMLYWAARKCGKPHTVNAPKEFIKNYFWSEKRQWFGGHWSKEPNKKGTP